MGNIKKVKTKGRHPASIGSSSNRPRGSSTSFSGNCRAKFGRKLKNLSETQRHWQQLVRQPDQAVVLLTLYSGCSAIAHSYSSCRGYERSFISILPPF